MLDTMCANLVPPGFISTPLTDARAKDLNNIVIDATPMETAGKPEYVAAGGGLSGQW